MEKNEIAHLKCLHYVIASFLGRGRFSWRLNSFFFASQELSGLRDRHD